MPLVNLSRTFVNTLQKPWYKSILYSGKYWRIWRSKKNTKFIPDKFFPYVSCTCFVEYCVKMSLLHYFKKDDCFPAFENKLRHVHFPFILLDVSSLNEWVWLIYDRKSAKFKPANYYAEFCVSAHFFPRKYFQLYGISHMKLNIRIAGACICRSLQINPFV